MNEFLNPKAMLTPGVAGGVVVLLVNGLSAPFPELPARYLALGVSFLLGGLVVIRAARMKVGERLLYWVANSLVIFAVGFGSNTLAREASAGAGAGAPKVGIVSSLFPRAYAEEPKPAPPAAARSKVEARAARTEAPTDEAKLKAQLEALQAENARLAAEKRQAETRQDEERRVERGRFFKKW